MSSIRTTYTDLNGSIDPNTEIIEESNYYPFGLKQKSYNFNYNPIGNSLAQQWQFGGKEYNQEMGLNWYDITARNYDPALGRCMNLDPVAEKMRRHSPYNYAFDNPGISTGILDSPGNQKAVRAGYYYPNGEPPPSKVNDLSKKLEFLLLGINFIAMGLKNVSKILIVILFFISCKDRNKSIDELVLIIRNSNYELFWGVTIEARNEINGIYKAPYLTKELNGKEYLLPNFDCFGCVTPTKECLEKITSKKFDIVEFYSEKNSDITINPYVFSNQYTLPIFNEFEKIRTYHIISYSGLGDCIIFLLDEDNYLAYVPNLNSIKNEIWKSRFIEKNKIDENWYSGSK